MKLENFDIFYIVALAATTVWMFLELFLGIVPLNFTFVIFFWCTKFLSGFGLILSLSNGFLLILDKFSDKIGKKETQYFIIAQIVIPVLLGIYGIINIVNKYNNPASQKTGIALWFDNLLFLYGIIALVVQLYILPLIREEFEETVDEGVVTKVKRGAKKVGRGVKKKYFGFRKKYAKVQVQDQMTIKEVLEVWRGKFAVYLLIPIALGSLIFTPITFVLILFWLKIFVLDIGDPKDYERYALLASMAWIALISSLSYVIPLDFYTSIQGFFWTIEIFYLAGIVLAAVIFIYKLISLRGITLADVKETVSETREKLRERGEKKETKPSEESEEENSEENI